MSEKENEHYPCFYCDETFTKSSNRSCHHTQHHSDEIKAKKESRLICNGCNKQFSRSNNMKRHACKPPKPIWPCRRPGCSNTFSYQSKRDRHELVHNTTKTCEGCSKTFRKNSTFEQHIASCNSLLLHGDDDFCVSMAVGDITETAPNTEHEPLPVPLLESTVKYDPEQSSSSNFYDSDSEHEQSSSKMYDSEHEQFTIPITSKIENMHLCNEMDEPPPVIIMDQDDCNSIEVENSNELLNEFSLDSEVSDPQKTEKEFFSEETRIC